MGKLAEYKFTILGCGSSPGTPRIHGDWGACDPNNPKNRRLRASLLVQHFSVSGVTNVVIDTGPDFRQQMLNAKVDHIDGVLYTHPHADHTHGIDDLRGFVLLQKQRIRTYSDIETFEKLDRSFTYCFETPEGSNYPPILKHEIIEAGKLVTIDGAGGSIDVLPIRQVHGQIHSLGFRFGRFEGGKPMNGGLAYSSDISDIEDSNVTWFENLDVWILDALMYRPHASHFSLSDALSWINKLEPQKAYLTHMHIPLDYEVVRKETPEHVEPSYDGLEIALNF